MNILLWIVQFILAAMFLMAGISKSAKSTKQSVRSGASRAKSFSFSLYLIGIIELLTASGLILPWLLNIVPVLTPVSAIGIVLIQLLAIIHHTKRNETRAIVFNFILLAMAAFVASGRFNML